MKVARLTLLSLTVVGFALIGCTKEESPVSSPGGSSQQVVSTTPVTVRRVDFLNDPATQRAVTRVLVVDEDGFASMARYDFTGYHPEITIGQKAEILNLYSKPNPDSYGGRFVTRFCVQIAEQKPFCEDQ